MKKPKPWRELYEGIVLEGQLSFEEWLQEKAVNIVNESTKLLF